MRKKENFDSQKEKNRYVDAKAQESKRLHRSREASLKYPYATLSSYENVTTKDSCVMLSIFSCLL